MLKMVNFKNQNFKRIVNFILIDRMQIHGKIIIPSVMKSSKPKVLPPIKPKENTELAKALLTPSENDAGTSSILSTPKKILKGASTNSSSKVSKKLKTKLDKLDKKIDPSGKIQYLIKTIFAI